MVMAVDLGPYKTNEIYAGECADMMSRLPDGCIDLTVTSPPYDNLRSYNGYTFDFFAIARQLIRVTKPGGVIVWVVADQTVNGSETGTSFKQALYFMAKGMRLHDTMIYKRSGIPFPESNRYYPEFEYMFVFSKGAPSTFNPIKDRKNAYAGDKVARYSACRQKDGTLTPNSAARNGSDKRTKEYGFRTNIWAFNTGKGHSDTLSFQHPASFPEALARDHILSWSNPGDIVLDPFMGSGTTAKMAMQNGRDYLGFDISPEYVELAKKRVAWANPPLLIVS